MDDAVCRPILAKKVMEDSSVLKALEKIVHPLVQKKRREFFEECSSNGHFMVIYDIPLLLENPSNQEVDYVIVATAGAQVQRDRVLKRPGMTEEKFLSMLAKQMPDEKKRELADFLINTDYDSFAPGRAQVASIVESIIDQHPALWDDWKTRGRKATNEGANTEILVTMFMFFITVDTLCLSSYHYASLRRHRLTRPPPRSSPFTPCPLHSSPSLLTNPPLTHFSHSAPPFR